MAQSSRVCARAPRGGALSRHPTPSHAARIRRHCWPNARRAPRVGTHRFPSRGARGSQHGGAETNWHASWRPPRARLTVAANSTANGLMVDMVESGRRPATRRFGGERAAGVRSPLSALGSRTSWPGPAWQARPLARASLHGAGDPRVATIRPPRIGNASQPTLPSFNGTSAPRARITASLLAVLVGRLVAPLL